ncbi:hypothetical protein [Amycolatopsis echigonensis]|uniref:hypothetical protein n=1 Tax=Amycolatopsis echigonensis TaxID=2576905 RepID=UPI001ABFF4E4|nr:hypothetical protein [Amycolatopsis niigatensis]
MIEPGRREAVVDARGGGEIFRLRTTGFLFRVLAAAPTAVARFATCLRMPRHFRPPPLLTGFLDWAQQLTD